jgi:hypothetical protein
MFIAILLYGVFILVKRQSTSGLRLSLILFAQFALLSLRMMGQGVISLDDRDLEDSIYGWYGQIGALMAYTSFWYVLYCIVFTIAFTVRAFLERRAANNRNEDGTVNSESSAYQIHDEPVVVKGNS